MEGFSQLLPLILIVGVAFFITAMLRTKKNKSSSGDNSNDLENNLNDNDMKRDISRIANNSKIIANILIFYLICSLIGAMFIALN